MSQEAEDGVSVDSFPGLILSADPNDIPGGAAREQVNAQSNIQGQLTVRLGYLEVSFDEP